MHFSSLQEPECGSDPSVSTLAVRRPKHYLPTHSTQQVVRGPNLRGWVGLQVRVPVLFWEVTQPPCCRSLVSWPTCLTPPHAHVDTAWHTMSYLVYLLNPPVDAIEGPAVCDVIDQDHTLGRGTRLTLWDRGGHSPGPLWSVCRLLRHGLTTS